MHKYLPLFFLLLAACKKEAVDDRQVVSYTDLSAKYNIQGLRAFDYNKTDKVYALGYVDRYEVRDENFNILKQGKLAVAPYSILYTRDSVYSGYTVGYYLTSSGKIIVTNQRSDILLIDPVTHNGARLFTDPHAGSFYGFVETDQYYVFSCTTTTACVFIDKLTNKVVTFSDYFTQNKVFSGIAVVKDQHDNVILSAIVGATTQRYIYTNGSWAPYQPSLFNQTHERMAFVDSRNYGWIHDSNNDSFVILDMNKNQFVNTNPKALTGDYFGFTLREHSSGDIIVLSGDLNTYYHTLVQLHLE